MSSDLSDLLERLSSIDPFLACSVERDASLDERRWWAPARLAADPGALDALATAYAERWDLAGDRVTQASFIVLDLTWYAVAPLVAGLLADGSMPRLDGAEVWLDPSTREGRLVVSRAAPIRDATVDHLRTEVEAYFAPLVEALAEGRWLGRRAAWWGIGDRTVGAIEHLAPMVTDPDTARRAIDGVVHHSGSPLDSPLHRLIHVEIDSGRQPIAVRATCCRFYRVPEVGHCLTCPLITDTERRSRAQPASAETIPA